MRNAIRLLEATIVFPETPRFGPGAQGRDEVVWNKIDEGRLEEAEMEIAENPEMPNRDIVVEFLETAKKERQVVEAKAKLPEARTGVVTWRNIPFSPDSFIRTPRFERSVKPYRSMQNQIEKAIEKILLRNDLQYHKPIKSEPGFYEARVNQNFRIKFRITPDNRIELVEFGSHTRILGS